MFQKSFFCYNSGLLNFIFKINKRKYNTGTEGKTVKQFNKKNAYSAVPFYSGLIKTSPDRYILG